MVWLKSLKNTIKEVQFSKVADHTATLVRAGHFYIHIFIRLALIYNNYLIEKDLPVGASKLIKTDVLFNKIIKERCEIHPKKSQNFDMNE